MSIKVLREFWFLKEKNKFSYKARVASVAAFVFGILGMPIFQSIKFLINVRAEEGEGTAGEQMLIGTMIDNILKNTTGEKNKNLTKFFFLRLRKEIGKTFIIDQKKALQMVQSKNNIFYSNEKTFSNETLENFLLNHKSNSAEFLRIMWQSYNISNISSLFLSRDPFIENITKNHLLLNGTNIRYRVYTIDETYLDYKKQEIAQRKNLSYEKSWNKFLNQFMAHKFRIVIQCEEENLKQVQEFLINSRIAEILFESENFEKPVFANHILRTPSETISLIEKELEAYNPELAKKVVVIQDFLSKKTSKKIKESFEQQILDEKNPKINCFLTEELRKPLNSKKIFSTTMWVNFDQTQKFSEAQVIDSALEFMKKAQTNYNYHGMFFKQLRKYVLKNGHNKHIGLVFPVKTDELRLDIEKVFNQTPKFLKSGDQNDLRKKLLFISLGDAKQIGSQLYFHDPVLFENQKINPKSSKQTSKKIEEMLSGAPLIFYISEKKLFSNLLPIFCQLGNEARQLFFLCFKNSQQEDKQDNYL